MRDDLCRLFRDIAHTRSLSRAASLHEISPSAASQAVQELERCLQVQLLDRSTRPLTLTSAGKLYLDFCRDVLRRQQELHAALATLQQRAGGTVRVAAIYSVGLSEMASLEREFARRAPQAELKVEYLRPEKVYERITDDLADLGLVSYPEPTRQLGVLPWRQEEMVVAVPPAHPLTHLTAVQAHDLLPWPFVAFDEDLPIRREVDRYLREAGVEPDITLQFDNIQMIKEAIIHGTGISIVPLRILQAEISLGRLQAIPLQAPGLFRPLGILFRKRRKLSPAAQIFLEVLQSPVPLVPVAEPVLATIG